MREASATLTVNSRSRSVFRMWPHGARQACQTCRAKIVLRNTHIRHVAGMLGLAHARTTQLRCIPPAVHVCASVYVSVHIRV